MKLQLIPKIRERRMEAHLTQTELAKIIGISKSHLSLIENGKQYPLMPLAFSIAQACSCRVDDLYIFTATDK
jgi:putative transcriptional regulator